MSAAAKKPTTMNLPVELLRVAKVYAVNHNTTLQGLVTQALGEFLRRHGEEVG